MPVGGPRGAAKPDWQVAHTIQQHARHPAVVFVVIENPLPDGWIPGLDPATEPFNRSCAQRMRIAPREAEIFRQGFD